jgi:hypothetical protein
MSERVDRRRLGLAALVASLAGALGYALLRGYAHWAAHGSPLAIALSERRVNFHLALVIAASASLFAALITYELASDDARLAALERGLTRAVLPALALAIALMFAWP